MDGLPAKISFWQAHEDLDKAQGKLKHEQRFGSGMLKSVTIAVSGLTLPYPLFPASSHQYITNMDTTLR